MLSLSVAECLKEFDASIKWPNDVLIKGKKISGILLENLEDKVIAGIGINTQKAPTEDVLYPTCSLEGKIKNEDILIILDDIDLPKGKIRFRESGSAGTHNGLRDIVNKVGITPRLRLGIGRDSNMDLKDYVLSTVDQASKEIMQETYLKANELIEKFIAGELCQDTTI